MGVTYATSLRTTLSALADRDAVASVLVNDSHVTNDFADYVALREGEFTFLPKGKEHKTTDSGRWSREGRQVMKPARLARRLIPADVLQTLTDKDFEVFANKIKAKRVETVGEFRLVKGEDIRYWYHHSRYHHGAGQLNGSCMQHDRCQSYFDIYVYNPAVCRLLILVDRDERLLGRALVWKTDKGTYMDRVYGNDATIEAFRAYAREQGWYAHYGASHSFDADGNYDERTFTVKLKEADFEHYPYMDTLMYLDLTNSTITSDWQSTRRYDLLDCTDGGPFNNNVTHCTECEDEIEGDDYDGMCAYCHERYGDVECDECGDSVPRDEAYYSDITSSGTYCITCYNDFYMGGHCNNCTTYVERRALNDDDLCERCAALRRCRLCNELIDTAPIEIGDGWCHPACLEDTVAQFAAA